MSLAERGHEGGQVPRGDVQASHRDPRALRSGTRLVEAEGTGWVLFALSMGFAATVVLLAASTPAQRHALDWQQALVGLEPWRAFTASWVHWTPSHAARNLAALALLAALGWAARLPAAATVAWLLAWPGAHALLLLFPTMPVHYGGLSGTLHAGLAVAAIELVGSGPGRVRKALGWGLLIMLALKLGAEQLAAPAWLDHGRMAVIVVPAAHLAGAIAGLVFALTIRLAVHLGGGRVASPTVEPREARR